MKESEVLVYNRNPITDADVLLECKYMPRMLPNVSVVIEQSIHSEKAEIMQSILWSQKHLTIPENLLEERLEWLDKSALKLFKDLRSYQGADIENPYIYLTEKMNELLNTPIKSNPHLLEARLAFSEGQKAAREALKIITIDEEVLNDDIPWNEYRDQVCTISGFSAVFEALRHKKTTEEEFTKPNIFRNILELVKDGARGIKIEVIDGRNSIHATHLVEANGKIYPAVWEMKEFETQP